MDRRSDARHDMRAELAWAAGAVLAASLLAGVALQLWDADLSVPFDYSGDANQNQLLIKSMLDHGWYQTNPDLGAPFGSKLYDFPVVSGDNLQMLIMKGLGIFSSDSAWVMNVFFLLTFPLSALTAFALGRFLGLTRHAAALVAILFALLPYHFARGEFHVFIGAYYAVPLGAGLALATMAGRSVLPPRRDRLRLAALVVACAIVGSAHVYYAAFTVILVLLAAVVRLVVGDRRTATAGAIVAALIGVVVVANHLPNIVYRAEHGANVALERTAEESEAYGLKLASLVLPIENHRLEPLARLRRRYIDTAGGQLHEGAPQALGTIGTLGLAGLLIAALVAAAGVARRHGGLLMPLAATTVGAILTGTVGGVSSVFAYLVTPQLRAWSRISVFVALFALLAVGLLIDHLRARRGARSAAALALVVLALGFLDQTSPASAPDYAAAAAQYARDDAFVARIEATVGAGAAILQLPYEPFPEPQPAWVPAAGPYDLARGYLHSYTLRWSYGAMKGRAGDWQAALFRLPPALVARGAAAAGFSGIYVDTAGYEPRGAGALLSALHEETGAIPLRSVDGRLAFFDLRAYNQALRSRARSAVPALRAAVLRPVETTFADGFSGPRSDARAQYRLAGELSRLQFRNPGAARRMLVQMRLVPAYPAAARAVVELPGGGRREVRLPAAGRAFRATFEVPPGDSVLALRAHARNQLNLPQIARPYDLRVENVLVADEAFAPFGPIPPDQQPASWLSPFGTI